MAHSKHEDVRSDYMNVSLVTSASQNEISNKRAAVKDNKQTVLGAKFATVLVVMIGSGRDRNDPRNSILAHCSTYCQSARFQPYGFCKRIGPLQHGDVPSGRVRLSEGNEIRGGVDLTCRL